MNPIKSIPGILEIKKKMFCDGFKWDFKQDIFNIFDLKVTLKLSDVPL